MRLLNTESLQFKEFVGDLPVYAILSHTWGPGETSYQQLRSFCNPLADVQELFSHRDDPFKLLQALVTAGHDSLSVVDISGFSKILRFCELAKSNDYQWVWIDTCCINKESSAELSEAINSMFAWYKAADVCWAYLADVVSPTVVVPADNTRQGSKFDARIPVNPDDQRIKARGPHERSDENDTCEDAITGRNSSDTVVNHDSVSTLSTNDRNAEELKKSDEKPTGSVETQQLRLSRISSSSFSSQFSFQVNEELAKFTAKPLGGAEAKSASAPAEDLDLAAQMSESRWFKRCWTLQEMLAPRVVNFVDRNWHLLGDRSHFAGHISKITGIREWILRSPDCADSLMRLSVAQKLQMASHREATRIEDVAYSLLGLFQINMTLIYGEGSNAFLRLQRKILKVSTDETIFAWDPTLLTDHNSTTASNNSSNITSTSNSTNASTGDYLGLLAPHPRAFANASGYTRLIMKTEPLSLTSQGVGFPILNRAIVEDHCPFASLPLNVAYSTKESSHVVCVPLALDGGSWHRVLEPDCIAGLQHLGTFSPQPTLSASYVRANTPRANLYVSATPSQFPRRYNSLRFNTLLKPSDGGTVQVLSTVCALRFPSHRLTHEVLLNSTEPERAQLLRQQMHDPLIGGAGGAGAGGGGAGGGSFGSGSGGGGGGSGSGFAAVSASAAAVAAATTGNRPASSLVSMLTVRRRPSERRKGLSRRQT